MIGRVLERKSLMRAVESDESQFVAVYGRRRIGKTYLVRETLGKQFCFEHSGIFGETFAGELSAFRDSLIDSGLKDCPELSNWTQAFRDLFYFKFMEGESNPDPNFWQKTSVTQAAAVWKGLAFERVCMLHVEQIKKALGISGVVTHVYGWSHDADDTYPQGAQIDLLIERGDSAYNVCEMKFSDERYVIKKRYAEDLRTKVGVFRDLVAHGKTVYLTLVTSAGLLCNKHSGIVQSEVTLDDLFRP